MWVLLWLGCHGKSPDDSGSPAPALTLVSEDRAAALMSVQGTSASNVWIVGADAGSGPEVLHFDGNAWEARPTGAHGDLWWVEPVDAGAVMVGANGLILDSPDGKTFTAQAGPDASVTLYGVWGPSGDDLWAVGGDPAEQAPPQIWRRQAGTWTQYHDDVVDGIGAPHLFYKVAGTSTTNVWIVGSDGILLHFDGTKFTQDPTPTQTLLTVNTTGGFPVAVGGDGQAYILAYQGGAWVDQSPAFLPALAGVAGRGDTMVAVGSQGTYLRYDGSAWAVDGVAPTSRDLHGAWVDDEGGVWVVGGQLSTSPLVAGLVGYDGPRSIPAPP